MEEDAVPEKTAKGPVYKGMIGHRDEKGGFVIWIPNDWLQTELKRPHHGWLFMPYPGDINTSLLVEKRKLKYSVKEEDMPILLESFREGMMALPGVEVESTEESLSDSVNIFDARFTFLEGEERRKRWVRNVYWGNGQLIIIAQGRDAENFEYWLPMFFNAITTVNIL
jgi:hypothetical protein